MSVPEEVEKPVCRCGKPCQYYSLKGGYSRQCLDCNLEQSTKRRAAYARRNQMNKDLGIYLKNNHGMEAKLVAVSAFKEGHKSGYKAADTNKEDPKPKVPVFNEELDILRRHERHRFTLMEMNATIINKRRTTEVWFKKKRVSKSSDYDCAMVEALLAIRKLDKRISDRAYQAAYYRFDHDYITKKDVK
jgi:hypothetical protein